MSDDAFAMCARGLALSDRDADLLDMVCRSSANALLDRWFESDALKAALAFDAALGGFSPQETGSALMLVWRMAQKRWGQPLGGPGALAAALEQAARQAGASLRAHARVKSIVVEGGRAAGVTLENGLTLRAGAVLSSLDARRTLGVFVPPGGIGFGTAASLPGPQIFSAAKLVFALAGRPPFAGLDAEDLRARLILAPRPEAAAEAKGAALAGRLPAEIVAEIEVPSIADPSLAPSDGHIVTVFLPFMPIAVDGGWEVQRDALRKRVAALLENYAPGFRERVVASAMLTPDDILSRYGDHSAAGNRALLRLIQPYEARIRTPLPGLYLCGHSAEPVDVLSGSAARMAAQLFLDDRQSGKWSRKETFPEAGKGRAP
jgi:phytoene dehydrogenase-like protein